MKNEFKTIKSVKIGRINKNIFGIGGIENQEEN